MAQPKSVIYNTDYDVTYIKTLLNIMNNFMTPQFYIGAQYYNSFNTNSNNPHKDMSVLSQTSPNNLRS